MNKSDRSEISLDRWAYETGPGAEIEIKKSRFIARGFRVESVEEARGVVEKLRSEHPKSRHVVWALRLVDSGVVREVAEDDGEPQRTAGYPILNLLQKTEVSELLIAVVRYFGGIKLGAGGLVRAYAGAAREALELCPRQKVVKSETLVAEAQYSDAGIIETFLDRFSEQLLDSRRDFGERIRLEIVVPASDSEAVARELRELSSGRIRLAGSPRSQSD